MVADSLTLASASVRANAFAAFRSRLTTGVTDRGARRACVQAVCRLTAAGGTAAELRNLWEELPARIDRADIAWGIATSGTARPS